MDLLSGSAGVVINVWNMDLLSGSAGVVMDRGSWINLHLIHWF
ncbi:hypothetical protein HanPSC8_Chr16g0700101 [Helianthus annuus]|nr:hypothetical protein HanPSC8_Chr16g0700101 [Helianthus annuus]